jgi:phosphoglycerate dehydrogenase-like enzyme
MDNSAPRVFVGPRSDDRLAAAVADAGGEVVASAEEADILVMTGGPDALAELDHAGIRVVQLPSAGIEGWFAAGVLRKDVTYVSATGAYAPACAEHALALMLALARRLDEYAGLASWRPVDGTTLFGAHVCVVGAGGIGTELIRLMAPFGVEVDAVTSSGRPVEGARSVPADALTDSVAAADFVVNALPVTAATRGAIAAAQFEAMTESAYLVNVGRGATIAGDDLVRALTQGQIAGAGLDVTDPEPLPDGHPLWTTPRTLITCHTANPSALNAEALRQRVAENVRRLVAGEELIGLVDLDRGY